uniref:Uncharacterized protein n=1 Tax=Micrurus surinamensis TaxID=129470 RepID=A0A2D4PQ32_MICSU
MTRNLKMEFKSLKELLHARGESLASELKAMETAIEEYEEEISEKEELVQEEAILNRHLTQRTPQRRGKRRGVKNGRFKKVTKMGNTCKNWRDKKKQQKSKRGKENKRERGI